ncbi:chemotaxis regulatory protein ChePep [Helicobacter pylori]
MKIILFNQNPMITKLLESVSKKLELSMEDFSRYQELSTRLKEDPEWILIADDECLEKLDQVDWLELKETISQNKNSVCMYKKGNEAQPFLEGFEMKIKKPFLPTEVLKVLQKKLGSNMSDLEPSQNLDPAQEVLETNWDELENLGDLEALVQEEPNNEEQLLPTLNDQKEKEEVKEEEKEEVKEEEKEEVKEEEKEEVKEEEKEEVKETPQEEEKPKDNEIQEGETQKNEEVSKELETQEELEIPKEETQEIKEEKQEKTQEQAKEQEPIKEETQENKEEKQEKTQDSPSAQELEAMQELVKEIQENSNGQEDKKETQENTETPQEKEKQDVETPQEKETQENTETPQEKEKQDVETPQEKETQENTETPQELEKQELETQEKTQESAETPQEKTQKLETQEDHYESIEDIPEPVMAKAMGEELPFLNEAVAKTPNNENDTETPKESVIKTPQEKEESDKTSSPLELHLNLQDLLKSLNQESLKSLLENKTLSIKITLEDKKPDA